MIRQRAYIILLVIAFITTGVQTGFAVEPNMADYTNYPIFTVQSVKPNILIILDNSGSMNFNAYGTYPRDGGTVTDAPYSCGEVDVRVAQSKDDAEEDTDNQTCWYNSTDLDHGGFSAASNDALLGIRFQRVGIPQGATITSAYIEYEAYATSTTAPASTSFTIVGEASDHAAQFTSANANISGRADTTASVAWNNVAAWTTGNTYQTPDLTSIVQVIVNRDGWSSGNAMVFKISGTGKRDATAYDDGPLLHVEYTGECEKYYGYFDPDAMYTYSSNVFSRDAGGNWSGNFLNWVSMRRVDALRKVLMGGLATSRTGGGNQTNIGEDPAQSSRVFNKWYNGSGVSPYNGNYRYKMEDGYIKVYNSSGTRQDSYNIKVEKDVANEPDDFYEGNLAGVLQRVGDKARWGNMWFDEGTGSNDSGGFIANRIGTNMTTLITNLQNTGADTWTPLAETYYVAMQYFKQESVASGLDYFSNATGPLNNANDPFYHDGSFIPCAKSFVILLTDGASTKDSKIPADLKDYDNDGNENTACNESTNRNCDYDSGGTNYLDDIALYARTNDLRTDLDGDQNMILYVIYAFGSDDNARSLLKDAARNGGFIDKDGDNLPDGDYDDPAADRLEWDEDGDGVPDTYFEATSGYELQEELLNAITAILERAAAASAVSVLATSGEGEGNLVQAYFKPAVTSGTDEINWVGYIQSMWVDEQGNMREDTNGNRALDIGTDKVITYDVDDSGNTVVNRFAVTVGDPYPDIDSDTPTTIEMSDINPLWEANEVMSGVSPDDRKIFTFIDKNSDQAADEPFGDNDPFDDDGEVVRLHATGFSNIKPYLGVQDGATWSYLGTSHDDRAKNLIEYIRGNDTGLLGTTNVRSRTLDGNVHMLGDIVHSTPVSVAKPPDNYGLIYGDQTYEAYYNLYKDRETVIFVGTNDGMLHAFTSWRYNVALKKFEDPGEVAGESIGAEIWAYVPQTLLPHLKWLPDPDYTHVYYVDSKPKVVDARIFTADSDHPNGWGTVLIGGLNMGGKDIWAEDDFDDGTGTLVSETRNFFPTYFCIDVTKPREPRLLWERYYDDLGLTTSFPAVLRVQDEWFAVFGSGPTDYDGTSTNNGHIFVVDLEDGTPYKNGTDDWLFETSETKAFMSSPVTLDKEMNFNVDAIYIGETYESGSNWKGKMYKVTIPWTGTGQYGSTASDYVDVPDDGSNPWTLSCLFDSPRPITAPAALSIDSLDNAWAYFGTGRYLNDADKSSTDTEYFFGIKDPFFNSARTPTNYYHSDLNDASTLTLVENDLFNADPYIVVEGGAVYKNDAYYKTFDGLIQEAQLKDGWLRTLSTSGERMLNKASMLGGIVFAPSFVPNTDVCGFGGDSYLNGYYYETGTAYSECIFADGTETVTIDSETKYRVRDKISLGAGMASSLGLHIGKEEGAKGFIQQSTGAVVDLTLTPAFNIKSGLVGWRER